MFENIGGKLKSFARVLMVLMILSAIGGGIAAGIAVGKTTASACSTVVEKRNYDAWDGEYYTTRTIEKNDGAGFFAGAGIFILVAAGGILSAWISCMFIYAYGQLVEDTENNRETNQQNQKLLKKVLNRLKDSGAEADDKDAPEEAEGRREEPLGADQMRCPYCGAVQQAGRNVCWECGKPLTEDVPKPKAPEPKPAPEKWTCSRCNTVNDADARYCLVCGQHSPRTEPLRKPAAEKTNPFADVPKGDGSAMKPDTVAWTCPKCNTINDANARYCLVCGTRRP